jgi:ceramide synthetase
MAISMIFAKVREAFALVTRGSILEKTLTFTFLALFAFQYYSLWSMGDRVAFLEYVCLVPIVFVGAGIVYNLFERFALYLNANVFTSGLNAHVFDDKKRLHKFCDQGWQTVFHILGVCFQIPTVFGDGLYTNIFRCFDPCPIDQSITSVLKFAYMFELTAYTYAGFQHRFWSPKKRDYYVMFGHHIATCALIIGSYITGAVRIGVLVMFIHDWSDIVFDITQFFNHAHMEGAEFHYVMEVSFLSSMASWFYARLYYLPFKILRGILFDLHAHCAVQFPGQPWKYPKCDGAPFWRMAVVLLSILTCMHCYWFYLFWLVLVKVVADKETDKGGVYERDQAEEMNTEK